MADGEKPPGEAKSGPVVIRKAHLRPPSPGSKIEAPVEEHGHSVGAVARFLVIALTAFLTVVDLFATQAILPSLTKHYGVSPAAMGLRSLSFRASFPGRNARERAVYGRPHGVHGRRRR